MAPTQTPHADLPCLTCTFTREFHDEVITSLAELRQGQKEVIGRLDKINGSIGTLFKKSAEHETRLAVLDSRGSQALQEVEKKVEEVSKEVSGQEAAAQGAGKVMRWLWPFIVIGVLMLLVLILTHATEMVKVVHG